MEPFKHPLCNDILKAPTGQEDLVIDLHIQRVHNTILHGVTSFWKPSPEELALLNAGKAVSLSIWGRTHPPLWVGVAP